MIFEDNKHIVFPNYYLLCVFCYESEKSNTLSDLPGPPHKVSPSFLCAEHTVPSHGHMRENRKSFGLTLSGWVSKALPWPSKKDLSLCAGLVCVVAGIDFVKYDQQEKTKDYKLWRHAWKKIISVFNNQ